MRFIFNFIFFGILFYLIFLYFPDAFHTLVGWANQAYDYLKEFFTQVSGKISEHSGGVAPKAPSTDALLSILFKN